MTSPTRLTLHRPDDWHVHLRDGEVLRALAPHTARDFGRAIIMPNLVPPVVCAEDAAAYRQRILDALPENSEFQPLMTLYLTESTDPEDVIRAASSGLITAVKLYPAGATTNSESGVRSMDAVMPVLERMAKVDLPLLVHGEVTDSEVDIFDREAVFIERVLDPLLERLPQLRVVFEHVTTSDAVQYVSGSTRRLAATITTHHLIINRNHLLAGGMRPHYYCLPVAKREEHRLALREAATSGNPRFFLGTDSAPHTDDDKETACGCAGVFNTVNAISCLAQVFEQEGRLDHLEAFASLNGPRFYGLPPNAQQITLVRGDTPVVYPAKVNTAMGSVTVFDPGFPLYWSVA